MEDTKKVHEPLKEGAKDYDVCICWNDRDVLWMDDSDMSDFKNDCVTMYDGPVGAYINRDFVLPIFFKIA